MVKFLWPPFCSCENLAEEENTTLQYILTEKAMTENGLYSTVVEFENIDKMGSKNQEGIRR